MSRQTCHMGDGLDMNTILSKVVCRTYTISFIPFFYLSSEFPSLYFIAILLLPGQHLLKVFFSNYGVDRPQGMFVWGISLAGTRKIKTKFLNKLPRGVNHLRTALHSGGHCSKNIVRFQYFFLMLLCKNPIIFSCIYT